MTRIALGIQYDGQPWHGWQSQPDGKTVQDVLERALGQFADQPVRVTCAGRTDTGVHGLGQVVHLDSPVARKIQGWVRGVNAFLPPSIAVRWAREVPDDFHARFGAVARRYDYVLYNHAVRAPLLAGRVGWTHMPLNVDAMREAAMVLLGTHDFSAFRGSECQARSPVKTLHEIRVVENGPFLVFGFRADAFLHHMIRNLLGSLVAVGSGAKTPAWMADILAARQRARAAPTFMPDGLYLTGVEYAAAFQLPPSPTIADVFPGLIAP